MGKITNGNERPCSNCQKDAKLSHALTVTNHGRLVAVLCEECQRAQKIQLTFAKEKNQWGFTQYFPLES